MQVRPFLVLPLGCLLLGGCHSSDAPELEAPLAPVPVASLPRHRHIAEAARAAEAVLLAPAPALSELSSSALPLFEAPSPGSPPSLYLDYLASDQTTGARPKRSLLILEPQGAGKDTFYAGCARWMRLFGEGATALDSGMTWGVADDVRRIRKWESLALERGRAVQLARAIDASTVAIGSLEKGALIYQVLDVSVMPSRVVGNFSLRGSKTEIVAGLPRLMRQIVGATGVRHASKLSLPVRAGLKSDDLAFLGSLPFHPKTKTLLSAAQRARLATLAGQPLGAMFVARTGETDPKVLARGVGTLLALAPRNALAAVESTRYWGTSTPRITAALRALDARMPRHFCVAVGNAGLRGLEKDYFAQVHYSEIAVRSAPHSAYGWSFLADALANQAAETRRSRYAGEMSRDEIAAIERLYPRALAAAWKATQLEPGEATYWKALSCAAAFGGSLPGARDALSRSLQLDPSNEEALSWGLQLFQPKWFGDAASFAKMARIAVENARGNNLNVAGLCEGLSNTNQPGLKRPLLQILLKHEPDNVRGIVEYSNALRMETGSSKISYRLAQRAVRLAPNSVNALQELGDIEQHDRGEYTQAIAHMGRAAQLDPLNGVLWVNLALPYAKSGQREKARALALKGHALGYHGPHPAWNMVGLSATGDEVKILSSAKPASS